MMKKTPVFPMHFHFSIRQKSLLPRTAWITCTLACALIALIGALFLAGCSQSTVAQATKDAVSVMSSADLAEAHDTAQKFLDLWTQSDYASMYSLITKVSQDAVSQEEFTSRYEDASGKLSLTTLDANILGFMANGATIAQVNTSVVYHSALFGDLQSQMVMNLTKENDRWRIQWEDGLILDQLSGGNSLSVDITVPARGNIYDRNGHALAAYTDAIALGVIPGEINPDTELTLLDDLSKVTGKTVEQIRALYENANPDWYIPVGEVSLDAINDTLFNEMSGLQGLDMSSFKSRYYFDGTVAAQVVGYLQPIPAEDAQSYAQKGYLADEKVGVTGLEAWGEDALRGRPKASLYVVDPQGQIVTRLATVDSEPAQSIYSTLDKDLTNDIQKSMGNMRGAVVVLERDSGKVLAMVSNPSFDANIFEPTNLNSNQLETVLADEDTPLLNRATQSAYPLGSVFKTITMAAALESGLYTADSEYSCGYVFSELAVPFYDWTYSSGVSSSGILNLEGGLIRSCNPWFWHIGLDLYTRPDHQTDLEKMAGAFGLGALTGIGEIPEVAGNVPSPANEYEAIGLAIGQDKLQVTPLQVASFIAAIGNGGTLYRPQLVEKIAPLDGEPSFTFQAEKNGELPVSAENLKLIQDAMYGVIHSAEPRGTAYFVLANLPVEASGKTGTAQTSGDPHAWFAGYTSAGLADKPDIAVAVILENAGEGSEMAAPLFRRIIHLYFSGNQDPGVVLPWESSYYQIATPTPEVTATPTPAVISQ